MKFELNKKRVINMSKVATVGNNIYYKARISASEKRDFALIEKMQLYLQVSINAEFLI